MRTNSPLPPSVCVWEISLAYSVLGSTKSRYNSTSVYCNGGSRITPKRLCAHAFGVRVPLGDWV